MKYFCFLLFTTILFAQSDTKKMYKVTYLNMFKSDLSNKYPRKEYSRLMVSGNKSIYQGYNQMVLDSLKKDNTLTNDDKNKYFTTIAHAINITDNRLSYLDNISGDYYTYKEDLDFNWTLGTKTKVIKSAIGFNGKAPKEFTCKNATTSYGGRTWEAWYCVDLPINAGPYKFKGLPGLIMEIADSTSTYSFNFYVIVERDLKPLQKLHTTKPENEFIKIDRVSFNTLKYKYESLTLNEQMNYNNKGAQVKWNLESLDGSDNFRDFSNSQKNKKINLIELDLEK